MNDAAVVVEKKGMSTGAKVGLGCGLGCLTLIVLLIIGGVVTWQVIKSKINAFKTELVALGFEEQPFSQALEVREDIESPQLLVGQIVRVYGNCSTNLAIVAQVAEIHGTIEGSLYFRGQALTISPSGHVKGDLDVWCQGLNKQGAVDGEVRGTRQTSNE